MNYSENILKELQDFQKRYGTSKEILSKPEEIVRILSDVYNGKPLVYMRQFIQLLNYDLQKGNITSDDLSVFRSGQFADYLFNLDKFVKEFGNRNLEPLEIGSKFLILSHLNDASSLAVCFTHPKIIEEICKGNFDGDFTFWMGRINKMPADVIANISYSILKTGNVSALENFLRVAKGNNMTYSEAVNTHTIKQTSSSPEERIENLNKVLLTINEDISALKSQFENGLIDKQEYDRLLKEKQTTIDEVKKSIEDLFKMVPKKSEESKEDTNVKSAWVKSEEPVNPFIKAGNVKMTTYQDRLEILKARRNTEYKSLQDIDQRLSQKISKNDRLFLHKKSDEILIRIRKLDKEINDLSKTKDLEPKVNEVTSEEIVMPGKVKTEEQVKIDPVEAWLRAKKEGIKKLEEMRNNREKQMADVSKAQRMSELQNIMKAYESSDELERVALNQLLQNYTDEEIQMVRGMQLDDEREKRLQELQALVTAYEKGSAEERLALYNKDLSKYTPEERKIVQEFYLNNDSEEKGKVR